MGIKITNVQGSNEIKEEPVEKTPMQMSTVRVRALSQLQTAKLQSPSSAAKLNILNKQIINASIKRLNTNKNLSIRSTKKAINSTPGTVIRRTAPPQFSPISNVPEVKSSPVLNKTTAVGHIRPPNQFQVPPMIESYIKSLEEQNREMRKMLIDSRKEMIQIQLKMHKYTNQINLVLAKGNLSRPCLITSKNAQLTATSSSPPPNLVQSVSATPPPQQIASQSTRGGIKESLRKVNSTRIPIFPITKMAILEQFESDLAKREISEYVFKKLFALNDKPDIDRPTVLLSSVLESIIDPQLLSKLQWTPPENNGNGCSIEDIDINYFSHLEKVKVFYAKLVNSLANKNFKKPIDKRAIETFIRVQIQQYKELLNHSMDNDVRNQNDDDMTDDEYD